ncbi:MAG: spore coat protein U domain-containing protein [Burkholderiales bacterium]
MNKRIATKLLPALAGAALVAAAGSAAAATTSTTVNVTATVNSVCNMQAASTDIAFTTIPAFLGAPTAPVAGNVTLTCNKGATVTLGVSNGNNFGLGQSGSLRAMKSGTSDYISYHVYQPTNATFTSCSGASTEWTSAISISSLWSANGGPNTISLCGVVDAAPAAGYAVGASYLDVVTVTATYP